MGDRKPYPSDLSNARWALIGPIVRAWKESHPSVSGHQGTYDMREIVNAILYQNRTGCQWAYLPHDLPPKSATYYYYAKWRDDGTDQVINELLRCQAREAAGRTEDPTLVVIDSQSVHNAVNVPARTTGRDASKKVPGRKRGIAIDIIGLIIAVVVLAAGAHDNEIGKSLLGKIAATTPTVSKALVDQGFKQSVVDHGAALGVEVDIVERNPSQQGFAPQPIRWRVEQALGTLILHRRLVRDYESSPTSSASRVIWASIDIASRRITRESAPTWRGA